MKYISVEKIAQVRLLCRKVLPAVYDESLSYLEGLSKLTFKLNETINSVNALNDNVGVLNDSVTELNARVEAVEGEINGFEAEITKRFEELVIEINKEVDNKLDEVEDRVSALENQITGFEAEVREQLKALEIELTTLVNDELKKINALYLTFEADMKGYVDKELQKIISEIPDLTNVNVIDPTTGKLVKIQVAINHITDFASYYAFTIDEWNELGLNINQTNSIMVKSLPRGMTCYEWLHDAKKIMLTQVDTLKAKAFAYPHTFVYNYLDGSYVWHDRNVDINQQLIASSGCYCCDEINTMAFTCDEINEFAISCFNYVMKANSLMVRSA